MLFKCFIAATILISSTSLVRAQLQFTFLGLNLQQQTTPSQQRSQVRPYLLVLTNCIAKRAIEDSAGAAAFKDGTFDTFVSSIMDRCPRPLAALSQAYDQAYGQGQGEVFINGNYAKDLPRAVLARIRPQLQAKADELRGEEAARAISDAQAAKEAEAVRQRAGAEAEQQASIARAEADRARAQELAAAQVAEAERLKQVGTADGAAKLLAVRSLDCSREQLKSLVKSGESAEVLASAVMTICGSDVDHFVEAGVKEYDLEHQIKATTRLTACSARSFEPRHAITLSLLQFRLRRVSVLLRP